MPKARRRWPPEEKLLRAISSAKKPETFAMLLLYLSAPGIEGTIRGNVKIFTREGGEKDERS